MIRDKFYKHMSVSTSAGNSGEASDALSWVTSNELSRGWVISGKYLPKENSVITCDIFITEVLMRISSTMGRRTLTAVVNMNITTIAMAE